MRDTRECFLILYSCFFGFIPRRPKRKPKIHIKSPADTFCRQGSFLFWVKGLERVFQESLNLYYPFIVKADAAVYIYKNPTFLCGECVQSGLICLYSLQCLAYPRITGFPQHNKNNNVTNCFDFINMLMAGDWHYIVIRRAYMAKEPTNHYDSSVLSDY